MTLTLDASVIVKWMIEDAERESDTEKATLLIQRVIRGQESVLQPHHWLVEVAAVLARLSPNTAADDVDMLAALEWPSVADPRVLRRATTLAIESGQHVFDTYYHAVALEAESTLVTADERYRSKAARLGRIVALQSWSSTP